MSLRHMSFFLYQPAYAAKIRNKSKSFHYSSFSFIQFVKFVKFFEVLVFSFNKYRYELCICVNLEIDTCAKNLNTPALIITCNMPLQILVEK